MSLINAISLANKITVVSVVLVLLVIVLTGTVTKERKQVVQDNQLIRFTSVQTLPGDTVEWFVEALEQNQNLLVQFEQVGDNDTTHIYVDGSNFPTSMGLYIRRDTLMMIGVTGDAVYSESVLSYWNYRFTLIPEDTTRVVGAAKISVK